MKFCWSTLKVKIALDFSKAIWKFWVYYFIKPAPISKAF